MTREEYRLEQAKFYNDKGVKDSKRHFLRGMEHADFTMINKACDWLENHLYTRRDEKSPANHFVCSKQEMLTQTEFIEQFKQAMKGEIKTVTESEKGVEWADKSPYICYKDIEDVAKEVIDIDWQERQDRLWNMIERNLKAQFIRKACKWLDENFRVSSFDATKIVTHFSNMYDLEEDFRKAMEGE